MSIAFLSYAKKDLLVAKRVAADLENNGIQVWFAQHEILVGDSIFERIREGILSADYLIVLLSQNSEKSVWVEREISVAFKKFGNKATSAIIPVAIDKTSDPRRFSNIEYVKLTDDYNQAIKEILKRVNHDFDTKVSLKKVINTNDFASDLSSEITISKGIEFYISAVIGILTIIVTLYSSHPLFMTTFSRIPKVYYDLNEDSITYPPGANEQQILNVLANAGIAPAAIRIRIINKGNISATEVKIGSKTKGSFLYVNSNPLVSSKTVWVDIDVQGFKHGDKEAVVTLQDLVPEKKVVVDFGYEPPKADTEIDVVFSGIFAEKVIDIDKVTSWSLYKYLKLPVKVFVFGLMLTVLIGIVLSVRKNPRLRAKLFDLLRSVYLTFYSNKFVKLFD